MKRDTVRYLFIDNRWIATDPEQRWFWTPEWQAGEREVDEHYERGETEHFDNVDGLIDLLLEDH